MLGFTLFGPGIPTAPPARTSNFRKVHEERARPSGSASLGVFASAGMSRLRWSRSRGPCGAVALLRPEASASRVPLVPTISISFFATQREAEEPKGVALSAAM